jgi:hypothetical protein
MSLIESRPPARKDCPITRAVKAIIVLLGTLTLVACQPTGPAAGASQAAASEGRTDTRAYRAPPLLLRVTAEPGGRLSLAGAATAGARVRLASPAGQPLYAQADDHGAWRLETPRPPEPRLFGLAMIDGGRPVQSEGFALLTGDGTAAQLRAGAGTVVLGGPSAVPVIDAVDYDAKGGAVVSGRAAPRAVLTLSVDGARQSPGRADGAGRFSLALDEPQAFSDHAFEVTAAGGRARVQLRLSVAEPLVGGPYRAISTPTGWRIDWVTPGGGLQTTLLVASRA